MTDALVHLGWLPPKADWADAFEHARRLDASQAFEALIALAGFRLDFMQTARLDRAVQKLAGQARSSLTSTRPVRLALLGSSTLTHLLPGIRVGALRRRLWVEVYEGHYGQYRQELQDPACGLGEFRPDVILLALDARHVTAMGDAEATLDSIRFCWELARKFPGCTVIQQAILPVFRPLLGNSDYRYEKSPATLVAALNQGFREKAGDSGIHLLSIDAIAAQDGSSEWHDEALWHRTKQEIHPRVSAAYGDQLARMLLAMRGRSSKCLVLDLDNTIWGGVIGDDGLAGIAIGQGSAVGEAHLEFQKYILSLSERGVILAVCSKNDENNAYEVFDKHPEMLLRRKDIACFVANWQDKASNLRNIARRLNIGLDSLVFADDNPFERNLIRGELPEVAVPELPEDPALYAACIATAGYFETFNVTDDDRERTGQYRANAEREQLREQVTDMAAYLASLQMRLQYSDFDTVGLQRIVQLINKTNQFNLTTRRYSEPEVTAYMADPKVLHLQFRLIDRFGDNGVICLIIGQLTPDLELVIDTWLMSCRVLGRHVEAATLNVIASRAAGMGARSLIGLYRQSAKNGMVKDHYLKLGFSQIPPVGEENAWRLELGSFHPADVPMTIMEAKQ